MKKSLDTAEEIAIEKGLVKTDSWLCFKTHETESNICI